MKRCIALACGTAMAIAAAGFAYAESSSNPDRGAPDSSATSANPKQEKGGGSKGTKGAKKGTQQTPPGTDRPGGESGGQSANPDMDKKKK